jgi:hypothetical protein
MKIVAPLEKKLYLLVRHAVIFAPLYFSVGDLIFLVQHSPLENASEVLALLVHRSVLKIVMVDAIDDRNSHHSPTAKCIFVTFYLIFEGCSNLLW